MLRRLVITAVLGVMFTSAAQAAWRATGETRFEPLHTVSAAPGQAVTLRARLVKEMRNTRTRQTRWVPMVNCRVHWHTKYYCPQRRAFHISQTRTDGNGVTSTRAVIKRSAVPYSYGAYGAFYSGSKNKKYCIRTGHLRITR